MLPQIRRPTWFDVSRLILVGAIWGAVFIFIEIALEDIGPLSIASWRVSLGAAVLLAITLIVRQAFPRGLRNWRYIVIVGCLNSAIPFFLISWGQQFISSAETALLLATGTFTSLFVSHFTSRDERINALRALGVAVGFLGVFILVLWDLLASGSGNLAGQIAVMLAGSSYAISSILARRLTHLPMMSMSAATMLSASLYMLPLAFLFENPLPQQVSQSSLIALLYLGIIATAFGMTLRFYIVRANGAVFMSMVGYLVPLFGVVLSGLYFADTLNLQTWISLGLILLGIAITRKGS